MPEFRWRLADEEEAVARRAPQQPLFDAGALEAGERHVGTGEFRGMEFLHVNARRIINEVPAASRMPFRYTINAYRGCSHACAYCLSGDTPILMADGRTKPLRDVRAGDCVYGTVGEGNDRRYVPTAVIDHWSTVKPAYRITLTDGTALVASADHRFLTRRGWKHVTDSEEGTGRRPHLTPSDELLGTGGFAAAAARNDDCRRGYFGGLLRGGATTDPVTTGKRTIDGVGLKCRVPLRVASIEPLGVEMPMYDVTTGTGDFVANGVISHNCFARPTHEYLGLGMGEDFERRIVVKVNAVERLRAELASPKWLGEHIAMGTNTDPYQRCEGKYHLTQGVIAVLAEHRNPFSILTKSTLILRDLDALAAAARRTDVRVNFSIGTLDERVWKLTEPGTPNPRRRVEAVRRLNDAGVPCGVLVAPVIPGLSDSDEQLREVIDAVVGAGAVSVAGIALHLRPGVRDHWMEWLKNADPELAGVHEQLYKRAYLPTKQQDAIGDRVRTFVGRARGSFTGPRRARSGSVSAAATVVQGTGHDDPSGRRGRDAAPPADAPATDAPAAQLSLEL